MSIQDLSQFMMKFQKGEVLFHEGDAGSEMYFIHQGTVVIEKNIDGKMEALAELEKGDFFGEMAVIDRIPRSATARAKTECEVLRIDQANFESLLQSNIEIAVRMIRKYAARLRDSNQKLETLLRNQKAMDHEISSILKSVQEKKNDASIKPEKPLPIAMLVGDSKKANFEITKEESSLGRFDPVTQIRPDLDLTQIDTHKSVSRKHARIHHVDGEFLIVEEIGVSNGTFVNGERLVPGKPTKIQHGAKLTFGFVELRLEILSRPTPVS